MCKTCIQTVMEIMMKAVIVTIMINAIMHKPVIDVLLHTNSSAERTDS